MTRLKFGVLAGLLLLSTACFGSSEEAVRVLLIGNSYTFYNDMPEMVGDLADSVGQPVETGVRAPGGWWWRDHAASQDTTDAIADGDWDYVVLQEQSMAPADSELARQASYPAAQLLTRTVVGNGGEVVLFLTWGHRNGSAALGHDSYGAMQIDLAENYQAFADGLLAEIAPVGMAWWMSLAESPAIVLYDPDGSHPSPAGSYLAAAVIASANLDVDANTFDHPGPLDETTAATLRGYVARAVAGEVPWQG